jgi:hypothetical protein
MSEMLTGMEEAIPALRRYARTLLRNPQDADDLVHDVLIRALDHMSSRRTDQPIRPWLLRRRMTCTASRPCKPSIAFPPSNGKYCFSSVSRT